MLTERIQTVPRHSRDVRATCRTHPALTAAFVAALSIALLTGCGDALTSGGDRAEGGGDAGNNTDFGGQQPDVREQPELAFAYLAPAASRDFVFVPNEALDTVSKIDADSLAITTIPVGDRPTVLRAVEALNLAVVLDEGSHEVSIIRAAPAASEQEDVVEHIDVEPRSNELVLAPDGRHALSWFSWSRHDADEDEPVGSLQTVTLIRTEDGAAASFKLTVGFQVRSVVFGSPDLSEQGRVTTAWIITDTGVSVVDLDTIDDDAALEVIPVSDRPLDDPFDREVLVTPSGEYAVARDAGAADISIVRLADGELRTVSVAAPPTDIDVFPSDGSPVAEEDRALVTVRDAEMVADQVVSVPVHAAFEDPSVVTSVDAGDAIKGLANIAPNGQRAVFYTTGGPDTLTVLDFETGSLQRLNLRKRILGVAISPGSRYAVAFHPAQSFDDGAPIEDEVILKSPAYSLIDLETGFTRLELSEAEVDAFTFWEDAELGAHAFLTFSDETRGIMSVDRVDLGRFEVAPLELGSLPSDVGRVVGRSRVWVNQEHDVGRMTFIEVVTGEAKTVTGFELNRFVR